jgi:DNA-binding GntR family transcriptional regulator
MIELGSIEDRDLVVNSSNKSKQTRRKFTATDLVYKELKDQILTLKLSPGTLLEEDRILGKLGFSRTPFREACMRLKEEGWLLSISRRGYLISPIMFEDMSDIYSLRLILESASVQIVASRAAEKDIQLLEEMVRFEEDELGSGQSVKKSLVELSYKFHMRFAELTGNTRIVNIMQSAMEHCERFDSMLSRYDPQAPWVRHSKIVLAIKNRNPIEASKRMQEHIQQARSRILNAFSGHALELSLPVQDFRMQVPRSPVHSHGRKGQSIGFPRPPVSTSSLKNQSERKRRSGF